MLTGLIIFDFDGVLADTLADMLSIARQVTAALGYPCQPTPADLDALERMEFSAYGRQLGLPESLVADFVRLSFERFTALPQPPAIFPGLQPVILQLARTHRMAVVTGNTSAVVERFLAYHALDGCFETILGADAPGERPHKLQQIVARQAQPGAPAFFVGDAVSDVRAAAQAGLTSIAVTWGHQSVEHLSSAHPGYLIRAPGELLKILR